MGRFSVTAKHCHRQTLSPAGCVDPENIARTAARQDKHNARAWRRVKGADGDAVRIDHANFSAADMPAH
jgi:hypothetical protein